MTADAITLTLTLSSGAILTEQCCESFTFVQERFTPFTKLTACFLTQRADISEPVRAAFYWKDTLLHEGPLDTLELRRHGGMQRLILVSRGYTALLQQNQLSAGMRTGITPSALLADFSLPEQITLEQIDIPGSYLYLNTRTTLWDAIAALSYLNTGHYPYVKHTNYIQLSETEAPVSYTAEPDEILMSGICCDQTRLISHYHMDNEEGTPDSYLLEAEHVPEGIVRNQQLKLDYRFLRDPIQALYYRDILAQRGRCRPYVLLRGWRGQRVDDLLAAEQVSEGARIGKLVLQGKGGVITSRCELYGEN